MTGQSSDSLNQNSPSGGDVVFPEHCLVGSIGEFAKFMAAGTEVPAEFYFAAGLTVLGHVCGTTLCLENGLDVHNQLYTVLLGDSGHVKKSTAMRKTIEFFENLGLSNSFPHVSYGVGSGEGLAKDLSSRNHLLMAYDELRSFIDKCSIQSSVLLPMVTSLFEQTNYENTTKTSSVRVSDAYLSLLGCCTTETYAAMWTPGAIAIGLPNRLFVVKASAKPPVSWPGKKDTHGLAAISDKLMSQLRDPRSFGITPDGECLWDRWYMARPKSIHATRLDTIGFRLMGLLALTMDKDHIDAEVVSVVTDILDYEHRIRILTDPIDADNKIAALEQKIRNTLSVASGQWVPARILHQKIHASRHGMFFVNCAVSNLEKLSKELEVQKMGKGTLYRLRPEAEEEDGSQFCSHPIN